MNATNQNAALSPDNGEVRGAEKLITLWEDLKKEGAVDIKTFPDLYPETTIQSYSESVIALLEAPRAEDHLPGVFKTPNPVFSNR